MTSILMNQSFVVILFLKNNYYHIILILYIYLHFNYSAYVFYISSTIFSNFGIHDGAKWQFYSITHDPLIFESSIAFSANYPYPYPKLIALKNFYLLSAKFIKLSIGSVPGNINTNGCAGLLSLYACDKLNGGGSVNFCPNFSFINSTTAFMILSGRNTFKIHNLCKWVQFENGGGNFIKCAWLSKYIRFQSSE